MLGRSNPATITRGAVSPSRSTIIHVVVEHGRVTLTGVVHSGYETLLYDAMISGL
jgi:hypothetical protein